MLELGLVYTAGISVIGEFSVAPMLAVTDRHCRMFLRLLCARMKLYTEMQVCGAIIHGERARFLDFDPRERPLAIQLAGAEPAQLALCARLAEEAGYDEVNLNVGCPSARVKNGRFGACLMAEPERVARCVAAMREAVSIPVTVKSRIGIDDHDSYDYLAGFIARVARGGCAHFIIHARKAWLHGLSPKENRLIPALRYDRVYRLKRDFPGIRFTINGGIKTLDEALGHLRRVDGVMIGREACRHPWMLSAVDRVIFNAPNAAARAPRTRADVVDAYLPYIEQQLARGIHLRHLVRPMLGLFHGQPGARGWRRQLSTHGGTPRAGPAVIEAALKSVDSGADSGADERCADKRRFADGGEPPALAARAPGAHAPAA